jgi:cobalt/nickel transport protein
MDHQTSSDRSNRTTWLLLSLVILLILLPLFLNPGAAFEGTDALAGAAVAKAQPDMKPWFETIWQLPGGEIESLLFALQAALGAGFIGYYLGFKRGQNVNR